MKFWERFYELCEKNNKSPNRVCSQLGFSNAAATHWKNGAIPKGDILVVIADYFDCSVDYLLGRVDSLNGVYSINGNNNVQVNGSNGSHSPLTVNGTAPLDEMETNLLNAFRNIAFVEKLEVVSDVIKKAKK